MPGVGHRVSVGASSCGSALELGSWRQRPEVKVDIRAQSHSEWGSFPGLPFGEKVCKTFCRT